MEVLLIPIFTVMAVVGLVVAVDNSTVIFDPITVPPEWENRGYTSIVRYQRTLLVVGVIRRAKQVGYGRQTFLAVAAQPTFEQDGRWNMSQVAHVE